MTVGCLLSLVLSLFANVSEPNIKFTHVELLVYRPPVYKEYCYWSGCGKIKWHRGKRLPPPQLKGFP